MIRKSLKKLAKGMLNRATGAESSIEPSAQPSAQPNAQPEPETDASPAEDESPIIDMDDLEVDGPGALEWVQAGALLLDIREPHEIKSGHATAAFLLPMNQVPHRTAELPRDQKIVVYCAAGARSFGVAGYLREHGFAAAYSLSSGFSGWTSSGGDWNRPDTDARFSLLQPVRLTQDAADRFGVDGNLAGTIQEASTIEGETVYVIRIATTGGGSELVDQLAESDLEPIGRG